MGWGGREGQQPASMLPWFHCLLSSFILKQNFSTFTHTHTCEPPKPLRNSGSVSLTQDLPHSGLTGLMGQERLSTGWGREKGAGRTTACHLRRV